ncbi:MAG: NAD(P)/FAD-dependent oxidoreductase, partial [Bauldia sp.]|nr:NAD(P)/FAD-dependent oxidoreductase [Bauldia sp.]
MLERTPTQAATAWLSDFGLALEAGDIRGALALFEADACWRDLVSFTWNIATQEGVVAIGVMLETVLGDVEPSGFALDGEATLEDGAVEAWFSFETKVARGRGHLRLRGGKCRTLLTTMTELKGFEESKGPTRSQGVVHGARKGRVTWLEEKRRDEAELGHSRQPYCVIIGGGQGG